MHTRYPIAASVVVAAALLFPAAPPAGAVIPPTAEAVPDSYIVQLRDGASTAEHLAARYGGDVGHVYSAALRGFSVRMSPKQAAALATDPAVAAVEHDTVVRIADTQPDAPWHLDRIDQRELPLSSTYTYPATGAGINVYVLDTGIRTTHQDFGGRARHGRDLVDNDADATDCHGHGTHVAGIAGGTKWGVAKGVTLHAVRLIGCAGTGPKSTVIAGIDWVTANAVKPAIANMSLTGEPSDIEDNAIRRSIASGVTYVAGAANDGGDACDRSPARMPEVLTVGNTDSSDTRATTSNFGPCLDVFAPGTRITSTWHTSDSATATHSGTSMATPVVTGVAAIHLATHPNATPAQLHDALVACATTGLVRNPGTGSPNRLVHSPCGTGTTPVTYENATDLPIPDRSTVHSAITVAGHGGAAATAATVEVLIHHPYRGDLALDLVAPDGSGYQLKPAQIGDAADDVSATFPVDLSAEQADGEWRLRIRDSYGFDTGVLDQWRLTL